MIDSIVKNIGPELISALTGQFNLSPEQASSAVKTTQSSLIGSMGKEFSSGNIDGLLGLLNQGSGAAGSSTFGTLLHNLAGDYKKKLGISEGVSQQIATFVLPLVLDKISSKTGGNAGKGDLTKMLGAGAGSMLKGGLGSLFK